MSSLLTGMFAQHRILSWQLFFFQHFEYINPVPSNLQGFCWWSFWSSFVCDKLLLLFCFKILRHFFFFFLTDYNMSWWVYLSLFWVYCTSWMYRFVCFTKLRKFWLFCKYCISLPLLYSTFPMFVSVSLMVSHRSFGFRLFFLILFCSDSQTW